MCGVEKKVCKDSSAALCVKQDVADLAVSLAFSF